MRSSLTRRSFLARGGAGAAGAYALIGGVGPAVAHAKRDEGNGDTVVVRWNEAALQGIRDTHRGPPIVARSLAMVHTSMYDAWAAYDRRAVGTVLGDALRRPREERSHAARREAISYAAYRTLVDLFPGRPRSLSSATCSPPSATTRPSRRATRPRRAASATRPPRRVEPARRLRRHVGLPAGQHARPDRRSQPLAAAPHLRRPQGHGVQRYIAPHWGGVTPFALTSGDQFRPADGPARVGERRYLAQALEILAYSATLDDRRKVIAEYWADGPSSELPPGHWCLFATYVSRRDDHDLSEDVRMFFAMTNAVLDASISAWDAKRAYDSVRPVTAIHYLFTGKAVLAWAGPGRDAEVIQGEDWRPYQAATVVTPPFPEYLSGHSTFSAAGAEILARFTGSDRFGASATIAAGSSRVEPGETPARDVTLRWKTFSDAADEAGISRRYGGIHFAQADLDGRELGRRIAAQAWDRAQSYIDGADS